MKVLVRSSSLLFTVLSIALNVPITRVRRPLDGVLKKPAGRALSRKEVAELPKSGIR